jgi:hypothetical protein
MSGAQGFPEIELPVGVDVVVAVIDAARAVEEIAEEEANEDIQDPETPEDSDPEGLQDALAGLIDDLNEDEQAGLIALAWIGRGDRDAQEWDETFALARERNAGRSAAQYLTGMAQLGDLLSEGLAAFGIIAEEVPR